MTWRAAAELDGTSGERRGFGLQFGLVSGLLIGLLVGAVVMPRHAARLTTAGSAESSTGLPGGLGTEDADAAAAASGTATGGGTVAPGSAARGRSATRSASGPGAAGAAGGAATGKVRGVTDTSIKIGVAYGDLSALKALGPTYDYGDIPAHFRARLDQWKRQGVLPVNGRTVEFVFRTYNIVAGDEERAACVGLIQDEGVFAVISTAQFPTGVDCVAREHRTPILGSDGPPDTAFGRGAPYLFSINMSDNRMIRNMVHWADRRGALRGHRIGLYYLNSPIDNEVVSTALKPELRRLGYSLAAEMTTDQPTGGPQDALAVQRFRAAGVDVAFVLTSRTGFQAQAEGQAYHPTYLDSDHLFGTHDTATSNYPPSQFDGAYAITGVRNGELAAGMPMPADSEACVANYERYSGRAVVRPKSGGREQSAEFGVLLTSCDETAIFLAGLRAAGRGLTPQSFVAGLETIKNMHMLRFAPVSFSRDRHDGGDQQRTSRWSRDCTCFKAATPFGPLFVP